MARFRTGGLKAAAEPAPFACVLFVPSPTAVPVPGDPPSQPCAVLFGHRAYVDGSGSRAHGRESAAGHVGHHSEERSEQVRHVREMTHERLLADRACPLRHVDWWNRSHWCGLTLERQVVSVNTPVPISCHRNNSTLQVS